MADFLQFTPEQIKYIADYYNTSEEEISRRVSALSSHPSFESAVKLKRTITEHIRQFDGSRDAPTFVFNMLVEMALEVGVATFGAAATRELWNRASKLTEFAHGSSQRVN